MRLSQQADPMLIAAINRAHLELKKHTPGSKEYREITDELVKLHKMKDAETPSPISLDTLATIGANLLGIVMVLKHEQARIITTKAWNNVLKPRL